MFKPHYLLLLFCLCWTQASDIDFLFEFGLSCIIDKWCNVLIFINIKESFCLIQWWDKTKHTRARTEKHKHMHAHAHTHTRVPLLILTGRESAFVSVRERDWQSETENEGKAVSRIMIKWHQQEKLNNCQQARSENKTVVFEFLCMRLGTLNAGISRRGVSCGRVILLRVNRTVFVYQDATPIATHIQTHRTNATDSREKQ